MPVTWESKTVHVHRIVFLTDECLTKSKHIPSFACDRIHMCPGLSSFLFFSLSYCRVTTVSTFFFLLSLLFFLEIELLVNHPWNKYKCVTWTAFNMVYSHYNPVNRSQSSIGYWKTIPSKRFKDWTILILSILYMYAYNLKNKGNYSFFFIF